MDLSLPADIEPFIDTFDDLHAAAVYQLSVIRPADLAAAWDATFDVRPPYFAELRDSERCFYIGATGDLLSRLEDHRDGNVRRSGLLRVCDIDALENAWLFSDAGEAFEAESRIGYEQANQHPGDYVHWR